MLLVSVERYRAITGDVATPSVTVTALMEEAQEDLAEVLERPLTHDTYTEQLAPTRDGMLWPRATPITSAIGWTIDGHGLRGGATWPFDWASSGVLVTYEGGWTDETVPRCIQRDLCAAVQVMAAPAPTGVTVPKGAISATVGDVAINYGAAGARGSSVSDRLRAVWSRRTLSYRYRVERSI